MPRPTNRPGGPALGGPAFGGLALGAWLLAGALPALAQPAAGGTAQRPAAPPVAPAPAQAQPQSTPPAGDANPERTSAQFGDWIVQCVVLGQGRRICEMVQPIQDQQRQQPIAVISVGRLGRDEPMRLSARVPVNTLVSAPAQLVLAGAAGEPLAMPFQRCTIVPVGCFADRELREDALRRLRGRPAEQAGRITWRDATGAEAAIPMSFRGFGAAYEALLREGG